MIPRYSRPEISAIWSDENKWRIALEVELLACEVMESMGIVPVGVATAVRAKAKINVQRIEEIDKEVKHDVIAFLTSITEIVGHEAKHLHFGLTSSDVMDTVFSVQLKDSCLLIERGLINLMRTIHTKALNTRNVLAVGRTHGMHADIITLGIKFARMYAEFSRALRRLRYVMNNEFVCAMSGAVGTYATVNPAVECYVAGKLGLAVEDITSQIIPRDRHAMFFSIVGLIGASIENAALEIRHSQRTEVGEMREPFGDLQKGSSAMPHKRNPVLSENLTGIARLLRSYVVPAMEGVSLWHERDISHSAVERIIAPDACILLDFALDRLTYIIDGLEVEYQRVHENLSQSLDKMHSQKLLLTLVQKGLNRESAYKIVQRNAFSDQGFKESALQDRDVLAILDMSTLNEIFNPDVTPKYIDFIFDRVFGGLEHKSS